MLYSFFNKNNFYNINLPQKKLKIKFFHKNIDKIFKKKYTLNNKTLIIKLKEVRVMYIAIAGGVKGIEREYKNISKKYGFKCKIFNKNVPDFDKKIKNVDAVVMFTGTVSHKISKKCCALCKKNDICLKRMHSSSINQLEIALKEICEEIE
jgi:hypothetical protein